MIISIIITDLTYSSLRLRIQQNIFFCDALLGTRGAHQRKVHIIFLGLHDDDGDDDEVEKDYDDDDDDDGGIDDDN